MAESTSVASSAASPTGASSISGGDSSAQISSTLSSVLHTPTQLSQESLHRLAASLPKYLMAGGIVLAFLIVVGLLSWWWKRRKRRARFFDDDDDDDDEVWALPRSNRRGSDTSAMSGSSDLEKKPMRTESSAAGGKAGRVGGSSHWEVMGQGNGLGLRPPERVYSPGPRGREGRRGSEEALIAPQIG